MMKELTMHAYAEYKARPYRTPKLDWAYAGLRTVKARFNASDRPNTRTVLKTLANGKPKTRRQISKDTDIGLGAARHEADNLVSECRLQRRLVGGAYRYSLRNTTDSHQTRHHQSGLVTQYFACCEEWRRLRRLPTGEYLRWCHCGTSDIVRVER